VAAPSSIAGQAVARAVPVDRVQVWAAPPGRVPPDAAPCIPRALRPRAQADPDSAPAWVPVQALAHVQDSVSVPAWAARQDCRLQARLRVRHVQVRVAVDARVTRRAKKAR
jgi:hypothetical protein